MNWLAAKGDTRRAGTLMMLRLTCGYMDYIDWLISGMVIIKKEVFIDKLERKLEINLIGN